MLWIANPVDSWIISDGIMSNINQNAFEIFISSVLTYPIRVKESESTKSFCTSLFSKRSEVGLGLKGVDTLMYGFTIDDTFSNSLFSSTSSDSDSVDNITLFSSVSQSSCFVWTGRSLAFVDGR